MNHGLTIEVGGFNRSRTYGRYCAIADLIVQAVVGTAHKSVIRRYRANVGKGRLETTLELDPRITFRVIDGKPVKVVSGRSGYYHTITGKPVIGPLNHLYLGDNPDRFNLDADARQLFASWQRLNAHDDRAICVGTVKSSIDKQSTASQHFSGAWLRHTLDAHYNRSDNRLTFMPEWAFGIFCQHPALRASPAKMDAHLNKLGTIPNDAWLANLGALMLQGERPLPQRGVLPGDELRVMNLEVAEGVYRVIFAQVRSGKTINTWQQEVPDSAELFVEVGDLVGLHDPFCRIAPYGFDTTQVGMGTLIEARDAVCSSFVENVSGVPRVSLHLLDEVPSKLMENNWFGLAAPTFVFLDSSVKLTGDLAGGFKYDFNRPMFVKPARKFAPKAKAQAPAQPSNQAGGQPEEDLLLADIMAFGEDA